MAYAISNGPRHPPNTKCSLILQSRIRYTEVATSCHLMGTAPVRVWIPSLHEYLGRTELKKLNYYRVYLSVTTLSDIMLASRMTLDPHMRSGNLSPYSSSTKQLKAKQACPNRSS
eukprot:2324186-Ditylum_brightwellii.AAC.2